MAAMRDRGWPLRQVISGVHFLCRQGKTLDHASSTNSMTTDTSPWGSLRGDDANFNRFNWDGGTPLVESSTEFVRQQLEHC